MLTLRIHVAGVRFILLTAADPPGPGPAYPGLRPPEPRLSLIRLPRLPLCSEIRVDYNLAVRAEARLADVFDTAPTANARRLLGLSKIYSLLVNKMLKSREEARTLREMLSFTKKREEDALMT